jgi:hypothetical protein
MLHSEFLDKAKIIHGEKYIYNEETEKHFIAKH